MAKKDIEKFKSEISELRETVRDAAASVRDHATKIREMGLKISEMTKTAKNFDPGPGAVSRPDYENLLNELEKLQKLALSLKSDEET